MSKNKKLQIRNSTAEFLIFAYQSKGDGVEVRLQGGTIWLSQKSMGLLFDTSTDNIGLHTKNIYSEGELNENSTAEDFSVVQQKGSREVCRTVKHAVCCNAGRIPAESSVGLSGVHTRTNICETPRYSTIFRSHECESGNSANRALVVRQREKVMIFHM